ncbi:MAG TPA: RNA methyltransferase [Caulobacteraceae bacterium]|jgi:tRNA/rRNA methyltransferase|nr:RNA methyltransferase [Caulobacteraceae bacterium]
MNQALQAPSVILDRPQLAENIGAVARVMANFGLSDLRLVAPRDGWPQERAWASASGADWPLDNARVFATLAEATADLHRVYATTARPREARLPVITPREAAAELHGAAAEGLATGLLFGAERAGLETADIAFCQAIVTIPIDPRFRSLNLAQAVAINGYEWRTAIDAGAPPAFADAADPASQDELAGLYVHLETELEAAGFFFPPEKTPSMVRNLRSIFARARLSTQEARTLRGVVTALTKGRGRVLARLARERAARDGVK